MSGCVGGSVGQRVGLGQSTKNLINLDLIEIIQFCWNIYDLLDIFLDILLKPPQSLMGLFLTLSRRIKAHLLLMYCIKNQSIGVS